MWQCNCTDEQAKNYTIVEESPSAYNYTMYAVVHPDATVCTDDAGNNYDMVQVLEELGYWVKIWEEGIYSDEIGSTYLRANIESDVGIRDYTRLHAYRMTNHPLVMMVEPTTMMLEPLDELYDSLKADETKKAAYVLDADGYIDTGMIIVKPGLETFADIKEIGMYAPFDGVTGWNSTGIGVGVQGGMGTKGLLTYYYEGGAQVAPGASDGTTLDACIYGNGGAGCEGTPHGDVKMARITADCGEPWHCNADQTGANAKCADIAYEWNRKRGTFENDHWTKQTKQVRDGQQSPEIYNGYCTQPGKQGYKKMLVPEDMSSYVAPPQAPATSAPATSPTQAAAAAEGSVPYIPVPEYLLVTCDGVACPPGSYVKNDCTCSDPADPCSACPFGTRCQNEPGLPLMCIDCTCGFCDAENTACCTFNGVNNCKSGSGSQAQCNLQNGFFGPFDGTGSACSGVEISYTATPNGCGCQPSETTPCTYDPNERSLDDQCYICSADDLVAIKWEGQCSECKLCLHACNKCVGLSSTLFDMTNCLASKEMNPKGSTCREECASVCMNQ